MIQCCWFGFISFHFPFFNFQLLFYDFSQKQNKASLVQHTNNNRKKKPEEKATKELEYPYTYSTGVFFLYKCVHIVLDCWRGQTVTALMQIESVMRDCLVVTQVHVYTQCFKEFLFSSLTHEPVTIFIPYISFMLFQFFFLLLSPSYFYESLFFC